MLILGPVFLQTLAQALTEVTARVLEGVAVVVLGEKVSLDSFLCVMNVCESVKCTLITPGLVRYLDCNVMLINFTKKV